MIDRKRKTFSREAVCRCVTYDEWKSARDILDEIFPGLNPQLYERAKHTPKIYNELLRMLNDGEAERKMKINTEYKGKAHYVYRRIKK